MNIINSEFRRRARFVESVVNETEGTLVRKEVGETIGGLAVGLILDRLEGIYVPNIKDSVVSIPKRFRHENNLPIIPYVPGETLNTDKSLAFLSPRQREALASDMALWSGGALAKSSLMVDIDNIESMLDSGSTITGGIPNGVYALTNNLLAVSKFSKEYFPNIPGSDRRVILGHSLLCLTVNSKQYLPPNLIHELVHTEQRANNPVGLCETTEASKRLIRDELEAYHVGAAYTAAVRHMSGVLGNRVMDSGQEWVESIRLQNADPEDPYAPTNKVVGALQMAGVRLA